MPHIRLKAQGFSSIRSFHTTAYSPYLDHREVLCKQLQVSNYEFNSFTNHRQVPVAGDTSLQSALKVISDAAPSIGQPVIFGIHKEVSSGASILREQIMQTDVAVEISEHVAQENQNQRQTYACKCSLFVYCTNAVTRTK